MKLMIITASTTQQSITTPQQVCQILAGNDKNGGGGEELKLIVLIPHTQVAVDCQQYSFDDNLRPKPKRSWDNIHDSEMYLCAGGQRDCSVFVDNTLSPAAVKAPS